MTIEEVKIYKERAMKIKVLLDEFFVDLQGGTYSSFSTPLYHMAKENLKIIKHMDSLITKWEPSNLPVEEVHLKLLAEEAWSAYCKCHGIKRDSAEYNISVSQKIGKLLDKTTESLSEISDYFEAKYER